MQNMVVTGVTCQRGQIMLLIAGKIKKIAKIDNKLKNGYPEKYA
jgi:hypothetical protein